MDIFHQLGFKLNDIPFTWPQEVPIAKPVESKSVAQVGRNSELSDRVDSNGIALEWKEIIDRNLKLPASSVCKLPDAVISINTGDATSSYIRQYPIPQAIQGKVKARIDEWLKNGWIVDAPSNYKWNSPTLQHQNLSKRRVSQMTSESVWMHVF